MEPKTTGKRIVSKGAYVANIGEKTFFSSVGVGLCLLSLLVVLGVCLLFFEIPATRTDTVFLAFALFLIVGDGFIVWLAVQTIKKAKQIDPGIPLTRANTANLPAPDSLVRASSEPEQAQEAELLRAAAAGIEGHEEQLLRPSAGGPEQT